MPVSRAGVAHFEKFRVQDECSRMGSPKSTQGSAALSRSGSRESLQGGRGVAKPQAELLAQITEEALFERRARLLLRWAAHLGARGRTKPAARRTEGVPEECNPPKEQRCSTLAQCTHP
mmetsp:Transcript_144605/g.463334  ORF Transcript_144605/g.463334 Transcript_144605/m.463334 type:complete len:119 (+) Transcript_144605:40-396(+)